MRLRFGTVTVGSKRDTILILVLGLETVLGNCSFCFPSLTERLCHLGRLITNAETKTFFNRNCLMLNEVNTL